MNVPALIITSKIPKATTGQNTALTALFKKAGLIPALLLTVSLSGCAPLLVLDAGYTGKTGGGKIGEATFLGEKCDAILEWIKPYTDEYWYVHRLQKLTEDQITTLFRDEYFVPYFGKPYDQLSPKERYAIDKDIIFQCFGYGRYHGRVEEFKPFRKFPFEALFKNESQAQRISSFLQETREKENWIVEATKTVTNLEASAEHFKWLQDALIHAYRNIRLADPEKYKNFYELAETKRADIATLIARKTYNDGEALASSVQTIRQLEEDIIPSLKKYEPYIQPSETPSFSSRLESKAAQMVQTILDKPRQELETIPVSPEGLTPSSFWYEDFHLTYQALENRPEYNDLLQTFLKHREQILMTLKEKFWAKLDELKEDRAGEPAFDALLQETFPYEFDKRFPVYSAFKKEVAFRKKSILDRVMDKEKDRLQEDSKSILDSIIDGAAEIYEGMNKN